MSTASTSAKDTSDTPPAVPGNLEGGGAVGRVSSLEMNNAVTVLEIKR